jgi:hypothetical protein
VLGDRRGHPSGLIGDIAAVGGDAPSQAARLSGNELRMRGVVKQFVELGVDVVEARRIPFASAAIRRSWI